MSNLVAMQCRVPVQAVQWRLNATADWQDVQHYAGRWSIDSPEHVSSMLQMKVCNVIMFRTTSDNCARSANQLLSTAS